MELINYKFFNSNKEFLEWQIKRERRILNIIPYPINLKSGAVEDCIDMNVTMGIVVTYYDKFSEITNEHFAVNISQEKVTHEIN